MNYWLTRSLFVVLFLSTTCLVVLHSTPTVAAPAARWTPTPINESVLVGTTRQVTLILTVSSPVPATRVVLSKKLRPFASVSPATLNALRAGDIATLTLTLSAPKDATPSTTVGRIKLRIATMNPATDDESDEDEYDIRIARKLPVRVDVVPVILPPDPGVAGKATLEGIDSDNDGVRDDIQRYIWFTYPNSTRMRKALTSFAIGMQAAALSANVDAAFLARDKLSRAQDCLWYLQEAASIPTWQALRAEYLNTLDRSRAYRAYGGLLNGGFFTSTPEDLRKARCDFDPDALPN